MPRTAGERSLEVVSYDCPDDRRRARLANLLLSYGARIQGSVYELWLTRRDREALWHRLRRLCDSGDLLRSYTLCAGCVRAVKSYGGTPPEDVDVFFG
jgi:CRISPR-associated protein Cas2